MPPSPEPFSPRGLIGLGLSSLMMTSIPDGVEHRIDLEVLFTFRMKGIGYNHPDWAHGLWKGELAIGSDSWRIEDCDNMELPNQHIQSVVKARTSGPGGVEEGVGVMEQIHIGPSRRYGFKDFLDPAT